MRVHCWDQLTFTDAFIPIVVNWARSASCEDRILEFSSSKLFLKRIYTPREDNSKLSDVRKFMDCMNCQPINSEYTLRYIHQKTATRNQSWHQIIEDWIIFWPNFSSKLGVSYARVDSNGSPVDNTFRPIRIIPHIIPLVAIIQSSDWVIAVYLDMDKDWVPLKTVLRHYYANIDYSSQALNFITTGIIEIFSQFSSLEMYPRYSVDSFHCDNALWLIYDPLFELWGKQLCYKSLDSEMMEWVCHKISNFDYLMKLNERAGRIRGEVHNHPIFPWVCDFTTKDSGWRPLDRTKFRLAKGDDQLREMYSRQLLHHVPELLSDIGFMVYRARVESKENLCKHVRSKWVPREYPVSIARMYEWTPEECIPELYEDPRLLVSCHSDMPDMEYPSFVSSPEEFIEWHRSMLESEEVSSNLHKWIDLAFGYLLSGEDAVQSLNVHMCFVYGKKRNLRTQGMVQLFDRPHPQRKPNPAAQSASETLEYIFDAIKLEQREEYNDSDVEEEKMESNDILDSLLGKYNDLRNRKKKDDALIYKSMKSLLVVISEICLANRCRGDFAYYEHSNNFKNVIKKFSFELPSNFRSVLLNLIVDGGELPLPTLYPLYLLHHLNIPVEVICFHEAISHFYSYTFIRKSLEVLENEKLKQSILIREVDSLRSAIESAHPMESVIIAIFERLLLDPDAAIQTVHRLISILCRTLTDESLSEIMAPLTVLLQCESSIKLLDRRFLLPISIVYGAPKFLDNFLPAVVEAVVSRKLDRSVVAKESIMWLSKRYGPVVCARFISSNLLRILGSCYEGILYEGKEQQLNNVFSISLDGDEWGSRAEACLKEIAVSYSVTFVTVQYLPFCVDLVEQAARRLTSQFETGILSVFRIVLLSMKAMTDHQLMNYLEDYIITKIIYRVLLIAINSDSQFSSHRSRIVITARAISLLYDISLHIGAENVRRYAKKPFELIFETFGKLYEVNDELKIAARNFVSPEIFASFPLWFVSSVIDRFISEWGVPLLSAFCPDPAFLVPFVSSQVTSPPSSSVALTPRYKLYSVPSGNRLFSLSSPNQNPSGSSIGGVGPCESGSLSALWCARISAAVCNSRGQSSLRFDHLSLCSFTGHSGSIRRLDALSNENSFVSASSDKTVKLWSVKPELDTVESQWTYKGHSRAIFDVIVHDSSAIASSDGILHIWDPFRGTLVTQLEWDNDGIITTLARVDRHILAAISSLHSTIKLIDTRVGCWTSEFKVSNTAGFTRALAVRESGLKMVVALSNGTFIILDSRTGKLSSLSHGNNTHTTMIRWLSPTEFLVCDADDEAAVYGINPRISMIKKFPDIVVSASVCDQMLTTIQNNNMLRVYNNTNLILETKMKSDSIPGSPTSIVHLPLNNTYLLGSSQGTIRLMC